MLFMFNIFYRSKIFLSFLSLTGYPLSSDVGLVILLGVKFGRRFVSGTILCFVRYVCERWLTELNHGRLCHLWLCGISHGNTLRLDPRHCNKSWNLWNCDIIIDLYFWRFHRLYSRAFQIQVWSIHQMIHMYISQLSTY